MRRRSTSGGPDRAAQRRGVGTNEIMRRTGKSKTCVWRWQERFMEEGVDGLLRDKTRPSRIAPLGRRSRRTGRRPDAGGAAWRSDALDRRDDGQGGRRQRQFRPAHLAGAWAAAAPGAPVQALQRSRSSSTSCATSSGSMSIRRPTPSSCRVDEKSQIQALDRTQPGLPMKKGRAGTMTHDYKRHGTTTLFAALNVLDGTVIGRNMQRHRHQEFIRFLNAIEAEVPAGKVVHVILDNYAAHKHPKVRHGSPAIRASPSTSRRPRARGSTPSRASSPS